MSIIFLIKTKCLNTLQTNAFRQQKLDLSTECPNYTVIVMIYQYAYVQGVDIKKYKKYLQTQQIP
jgi:hypothetical protein